MPHRCSLVSRLLGAVFLTAVFLTAVFLTAVFCGSAVLAPVAAAQQEPQPAEPQLSDAERTFAGSAQVTAVDLVIDVRDADGRVPTDLTAADFVVLEDGEEQPVIGVELFSRGTAAGSLPPAEVAERQPPPQREETAWSWNTVIYFDQVLSSSSSMRKATQSLAAQAGRLTSLGTVEIVVADPFPHRVLEPTRSARLVEQMLLQVGRTTSGRDAIRRLRRNLFDTMLMQREMAGRGAGIASGPVSDVGTGRTLGAGREDLVWTYIMQESDLLLEQQDRMLTWTTAYLGEGPRALLLVNDGYDLDPRDFYLVGIEDGNTLASINSLLQTYSPVDRFHQMVQAIAAKGWVCVNMAFSDMGGHMSVASAEISGKGKMGPVNDSFDENTITDLPTSLVFRPKDPLANLAQETGGELVTAAGKLPQALVRLGQRVRLTYQVARLPDGALHPVEVRSRRPGLEVRAPEWSGSPAPQAVSSARARRMLSGNPEPGDLPLVSAVAVDDGEGLTGRRRATLQARVDLSELSAALPADGALRVTFAVELEGQMPFVQSDLVQGQDLAGLSAWTYTLPVSLPEESRRVAVVIEELSTGAWGGGLAARVSTGEGLPELEGGRVAAVRGGGGGGGASAAELGFDLPVELLPDPKVVMLIPPAGGMLTGNQRFETLVTRAGVERVEFLVDGESRETVGRSPFTARLDLGRLPDLHTVEAVAYDAEGEELGRDSVQVNQGAGSFRVRLIEPRSTDRMGPVDVEAEVSLRQDDELDRVEIAWNDELVATLYAPPFRQQVRIPPESPVGYITVTAHLKDGGGTAEDVIFMNGPGGDERLDVRLVELFTVVTNAEGRPVLGLGEDDFRVYEAGREQSSVAVRDGTELPVSLALLLDTSASMVESLQAVQIAAIDFLYLTLDEGDRAMLVSFDSQPRLAQPLTSDLEAVARKVVSLKAGGYTALCDALAFSLVQVQPVEGRRALVVLTDGAGREERVSFATCQRLAQQVGVPIYGIVLREAGGDPAADVEKITASVGGRVFYVENLDNLGSVYQQIRDELRGQYLLTYSPADTKDGEWREIEVEVADPGLEARTVAGYWP